MYKSATYFSLFILSFVFYSCAPEDVVTTFENGSTKEIYAVNDEGQKNGVYKLFREDGTLQEESNFKKDQLVGQRKIYFQDGKQIEILENYKDGILEGEHVDYYESGGKLIVSNYVDGKMNGLLTKYYEDGKVMETVTFKDNMEMGPFKEYYANGQVQWEGNFLNGDQEFGLLTQFDESGSMIKKMMCDSLGVCQTIWTPEKGDIELKEFNLSKPEH